MTDILRHVADGNTVLAIAARYAHERRTGDLLTYLRTLDARACSLGLLAAAMILGDREQAEFAVGMVEDNDLPALCSAMADTEDEVRRAGEGT